MDLFSCYNIIKDNKLRKKIINIESIAYKRSKAVENRIKTAVVALENNDIKTFSEIMNIDTKSFSKVLDSLPENEREILMNDAKRDTEEQQKRLQAYQHQRGLSL